MSPRPRITRGGAARLLQLTTTPRGAGLFAAALAAMVYLFGPPGGDAAAHLYQTGVWREHGWQLWDNLWYGGRYSQVNYSLTYYPLSALLGTVTVIAGSAGAAAAGFAHVMRSRWPGHETFPVIAASIGLSLSVLAGTFPFLLGFALAMGALVAVLAGRTGLAGILALITTLSHPLAFVFLVVVLVAIGITHPEWRRRPSMRRFAIALVTIMALQGVLMRAFSTSGATYPFDPRDAIAAAAFCLVGAWISRGLPDHRVLFAIFTCYGLIAALALMVSNPMGGNVVRLLLVMGVPLLLIPMAARGFQPRGAIIALLIGAGLWQALPAVAGWQTAQQARAASERFWLPAIGFLDRYGTPQFRVQVVATADNWEAYYLARRGVPLARGWFRQDDFPGNRPLYRNLTAASYQAWMRRTGIRYVLLPDDPLDYTGQREAELLRSGRSGLSLVASVGDWTMYELPDATPIVTPASSARVVRLTSESLVMRITRAGVYRVRVRYTPYWQLEGGGENACVSPIAPWGTRIRVTAPGTLRLRFAPNLGSVVRSVIGDSTSCHTTRPDAPLTPSRRPLAMM
ncbi:MAG: hypothetical protein H6531_07420 [Actinobacteria bacterium]|nr:hypothetical protein [Actinomycetota bacterium]